MRAFIVVFHGVISLLPAAVADGVRVFPLAMLVCTGWVSSGSLSVALRLLDGVMFQNAIICAMLSSMVVVLVSNCVRRLSKPC